MEKGATIIGIARYDEKKVTSLEKEPEHLINTISRTSGGAGGIGVNIAAALSGLTRQEQKLIARIGNDPQGRSFKADLRGFMVGDLQIDPMQQTSLSNLLLDLNGNLLDIGIIPGAGELVSIPERMHREKHNMIITDLFTLIEAGVFNKVNDSLRRLDHKDGIFALNLGGAIARSAPADEINRMINAFNRAPDIVIGNEAEFTYLSGNSNMYEALLHTFLKSRLVIITRGSLGSFIRYEDVGKIIQIKSQGVSPDKIIDTTGAGDAWMATFLAFLDLKNITEEKLIIAARVASFAGARILTHYGSHLVRSDIHAINYEYKDILEQEAIANKIEPLGPKPSKELLRKLPKIIIFIGPPGTGKSQAVHLLRIRFDLDYFTAGGIRMFSLLEQEKKARLRNDFTYSADVQVDEKIKKAIYDAIFTNQPLVIDGKRAHIIARQLQRELAERRKLQPNIPSFEKSDIAVFFLNAGPVRYKRVADRLNFSTLDETKITYHEAKEMTQRREREDLRRMQRLNKQHPDSRYDINFYNSHDPRNYITYYIDTSNIDESEVFNRILSNLNRDYLKLPSSEVKPFFEEPVPYYVKFDALRWRHRNRYHHSH